MREDRRRHYDDGFRREALELIKAGAGKGVLAGRLAIPAYTARNWIRLYRSGGEEAVMGSNGSRRYDWETKVAAARDRVEGGMTKTEVMARYGVASVTALQRWCREYRAGGAEALRPRPKGRPKGARSKPKPKPTREQELAEQVAYLKAKVAYLEKLRACGRTSHETRAKRRRPTARRAGTPARPSPEDSRAAALHVLPPPVAHGACDTGRPRAVGARDLGTDRQRVRPPAGAHVPGPRVRPAGVGQERAQGHAPHGAQVPDPRREPVEEIQLVQGRDGWPRA